MSFVLIPCKSLDGGKSRLAPVLDREGRRAFCEMLLVRTLTVAKSVFAADAIRLVSGDRAAREVAQMQGVQAIDDNGDGLNAALDGARKQLLGAFGGGVEALIFPTDLPLASGEALRRVIQSEADVAIVPDRNDEGTNLLWLGRGSFRDFSFSFGARSFSAHCDTARDAGCSWQAVRDAALAFDVDNPEDYIQWQASKLQEYSE